jgi:hypothetical protein
VIAADAQTSTRETEHATRSMAEGDLTARASTTNVDHRHSTETLF